jgi:hypothetical protein
MKNNLILSISTPTKNKEQWLKTTTDSFRLATNQALEVAKNINTKSVGRIHFGCYFSIRNNTGLSSEYTRMAIHKASALMSSYKELQKTKQKVSFPTTNNIGLGVGARGYKLIETKKENGFFVYQQITRNSYSCLFQ